ncbi:hypothetical protein POPTR_006G198401v4 [Populus trichocarpa]|uniref:Uncharacterized protein n=1 Tax=Populus trichocarpa TaxID=3694 RepID=A0ACC0SVK2_POPTR|nr:hypothetical protein POPTR_006G198401v4 [Populus trichocarpa]
MPLPSFHLVSLSNKTCEKLSNELQIIFCHYMCYCTSNALSTGFNLAQAGFLTVSSLPSTMTPTSQVLAQSESHNKMLFKTQTVAANLGRKPPRTILTQSLTPAGPAVCPPYCPKN